MGGTYSYENFWSLILCKVGHWIVELPAKGTLIPKSVFGYHAKVNLNVRLYHNYANHIVQMNVC